MYKCIIFGSIFFFFFFFLWLSSFTDARAVPKVVVKLLHIFQLLLARVSSTRRTKVGHRATVGRCLLAIVVWPKLFPQYYFTVCESVLLDELHVCEVD